MYERPASDLAGRWSFSLRHATRAVIGTLRPTEQRRAITESRWCDTWPLELSVLPDQGANPSRNPFEPTLPALYGAEGARTPDLCNANAALSQLSYSPALARASGECFSAAPVSQTETAPQPSGAAVTATNLARRPLLSSRRADIRMRNARGRRSGTLVRSV